MYCKSFYIIIWWENLDLKCKHKETNVQISPCSTFSSIESHSSLRAKMTAWTLERSEKQNHVSFLRRFIETSQKIIIRTSRIFGNGKTQSSIELTILDTGLVHFKPHLTWNRQRWQFLQDRIPEIILIFDNFKDISHLPWLFLLNHMPEERMARFMFGFHLRS